MARKLKSSSKEDSSTSTKSTGIIASKALEKLGEIPVHHNQNVMNGIDRHEMIAMAAYYRSQKRSFNSGDEIQDWLEAESEIDDLI